MSDVTPRQYARAILGLVADDTGGRITAEIAAALDVDDQYFSQMFSRGEAKAEQDRLEWEARRAGQIARLTGAMRSAL